MLFVVGSKVYAQEKPAEKKKGVDIMITQSPKIMVKVEAVTNNTCYGESKGAINITPYGGFPPYRYVWSSGDTTQDVAALKAGIYKVVVSDNLSCSDTMSVTITAPEKINGTVESVRDILCYGYDNGEVDISVKGGKAPYTYNWSNGAKTEDLKGVTSGRYSVLITDSYGCQEIVPAEVQEKPLIVRWVDDIKNIKCSGDSSGSIDITVSGGVPPYTYKWSSGETSEDLRSLKAGNYEVVVKDSKGCTEVSLAKVVEPAPIAIAFDEVRNMRCFGDQSGTINVSIQGGKPPYKYLWNTGATTQDIAGIGEGEYVVEVTDNNACVKSAATKVTGPPLLAVDLVSLQNVKFNGGSTGSVNIAVKGGVPPYKYRWSNGSETPNISNLAAGGYSVRVTDATGCAKIMSVSVTQPSPLVVQLENVRNITCNGEKTGEINISVAGGVAPYTFTWTNGVTIEDLNNIGAGKYGVTVTDANGYSQKVEAEITEPPALKVKLENTTNILCNGYTTGVIDVKTEGGVQPYRYRWNNGSVTQDLVNIPAGEYLLKVTDANYCEQNISTVITEPEPLKLAFESITHINCNGANTGQINVNVAGGIAPYQYKWNNGAVTEDLKDIKAGDYNINVIDSKGCAQQISTVVAEPPVLLVKEDLVTHVDCNGNSSGSISLNVIGGVTPYQFAWNTGSTTKNISNLKAGAYNMKVTDAKGCVSTFTQNIRQPEPLVKKVEGVKDILCFGDAKGSINISVSGGVVPYKYRWSNGAITQDIIDIKAGKYSVLIADANGCSDSLSATVVQNTLLTPTVSVVNINCFGEKTGAVNLAVQGGVAPYTFKWNNGQVTQNITGLTAGKYAGIITDSKGCFKNVDAYITEPSKFVASLENDKGISCFGESTGFINVRVSGGTTPYKFKWNHGDSTQNISKLPAGTYVLTAKDAKGCQQRVETTLTQPSKIEHAVKGVTHVMCNGNNTGAIDIVVAGGVGPYSYKWSNGATTQDIDGVPSGKYNVTLTDANGCAKALDAEITQPPLLTVKLDTTVNILCNGDRKGSIKLDVSGGVLPYKYSWSNGAVTKDISDLPAGSYSVLVTDAKGCLKTMSVTLAQPPALVATLASVKNISCNGDKVGAVSIDVVGGVKPYTFKWSNGSTSQNLTNIAAGTYTVEIVDKNGCRQSLAATVTQPSKLVVSVASVKNVSCFNGKDGSIDIIANGGTTPYQYAWSNRATTQDITGVEAGTYSLTIKDANGCSDSTVYATIKQPQLLEASVLKVVDVLKHGEKTGSIDLNIAGGVAPYTYSWSNGAVTQNVKALPAGNYSVIVKDANSCEKIISTLIKQPPALAVTIESVKDIKCNGDNNGAITLNVTGGAPPYKYAWSNGDSTKNLANVTAGDYTVKVSDVHGYYQTLTAKIVQPSKLVGKIDMIKNVSCFSDNSGAVNITMTGGEAPYKFNWNSGQTTEDLVNVPAADYTLTVTDAIGCKSVIQASVTQPSDFTAIVSEVKNINCKGEDKGEIYLDVKGGVTPYNYYWSNGARTKDITKAIAGQYSVKVVDNNGCTNTVTASITEPSLLVAKLGAVTDNLCNGERKGSINIDVAGGTLPYKYKWSNGDSTKNLTAIPKGEYTVTVIDAKQCMQKLTAVINEPQLLSVVMKDHQDVACYDNKTGRVNVEVNGGTKPYSFAWSNGAKTQNLLDVVAGEYQLTVKDAKGCSNVLVAKIQQPEQLTIRLDTVRNILCNGDSKGLVDVSVTGGVLPYTYTWSNGAHTEDLTNVLAGNYSILVKDAKGCTKSLTTAIQEPAKLTAKVDPITHIKCAGEETGLATITAQGGVAPYKYLWNNGVTSAKLENTKAGEYIATITDANGCNTTQAVVITEPAKLIKTIDAITNIQCFGENTGSIQVTVREGIAPYTFKWNNGESTEDIRNLVAGNYKLTITEGNGCKSVLEAVIEEPTKFIAAVDKVTDVLCYGNKTGAIEISVSGGVEPHTFAWSNGSKTEDLSDIGADSYSVVVSDGNGCKKTLYTEIKEPTNLALRIDSVKNVKCCGDRSGAIFITVEGGVKPYRYNWSHGATTEDIQNLELGVYTVNVTDANGCMISSIDDMTLYEQVVSKGKFTTRDILFDVGKATIKPESFNTINRIASFMKEHPDITFRIEGHTDSDGSDDSNQKLSEDRSIAIRLALIKFGIRENRLQAKGWGEAKPIATNLTAEGKALNRRVEFVSLTGTNDGNLMYNELNKMTANE